MKKGVILQFFEWYCPSDGSLWTKIASEADFISDLGIDNAWLPPAYKGAKGPCSEGYDVYDLYDLGEFEQRGAIRTKYGTKEEYIHAVKSLQQKGIKVYADVVLNHMGGADANERVKVRKVNLDNRNQFESEPFEIEAATKFIFPGRNKKYSAFEWDYHCFTGVGYAEDLKEDGIYTILNDFGDSWESVLGDEKGNYDYLLLSDIELRNQSVCQELKNWGKWFYETAPFEGIRLDALKHISPDFIKDWLDYMCKEVNPKLEIIGEYWTSSGVIPLQQYLEAIERRFSLFDCPLHFNFNHASQTGKDFDLRTIFDNTLVKAQPDLAVTFVENHDTQPLQSLESPVDTWFKPLAYSLILLRKEGRPCVFFSDLFGSCYTDKGTEIILPKIAELERLLLLRKTYDFTTQEDYFDNPNCIGWIRNGKSGKQDIVCAVILSNGEKGYKKMSVGKQYVGHYFVDYLENCKEVIHIDDDGFGEFQVNESSVAVWILKE